MSVTDARPNWGCHATTSTSSPSPSNRNAPRLSRSSRRLDVPRADRARAVSPAAGSIARKRRDQQLPRPARRLVRAPLHPRRVTPAGRHEPATMTGHRPATQRKYSGPACTSRTFQPRSIRNRATRNPDRCRTDGNARRARHVRGLEANAPRPLRRRCRYCNRQRLYEATVRSVPGSGPALRARINSRPQSADRKGAAVLPTTDHGPRRDR